MAQSKIFASGASGKGQFHSTVWWEARNGVVIINIEGFTASKQVLTTIGTMPEGFRPRQIVRSAIRGYQTSSGYMAESVAVNTDGTIQVYPEAGTGTLWGEITYFVG